MPNPALISGFSTPLSNGLNTTPTLSTDNQSNVWQFGDIPKGGYSSNAPIQQFYKSPTGIQDYNDSENEPRQSFGTTYPTSTYYECQWMGPPNQNPGLPNPENKYSAIPCSYRPNFTEVGRYICNENPNLTGNITNCDNVSHIL
jgi:hypothetical protein